MIYIWFPDFNFDGFMCNFFFSLTKTQVRINLFPFGLQTARVACTTLLALVVFYRIRTVITRRLHTGKVLPYDVSSNYM